MIHSEVVSLLTLAGTYDYRRVGDADVEAWLLTLDDIGYEEARLAVLAHYRESTDRLMPAHVRRGVKAIREQRRRTEPHEARQSRFDQDMGREVRTARGMATVRQVLEPLAAHLAAKSGDPARLSAVEQLRAITAGPEWVDADAAASGPADGEEPR